MDASFTNKKVPNPYLIDIKYGEIEDIVGGHGHLAVASLDAGSLQEGVVGFEGGRLSQQHLVVAEAVRNNTYSWRAHGACWRLLRVDALEVLELHGLRVLVAAMGQKPRD